MQIYLEKSLIFGEFVVKIAKKLKRFIIIKFSLIFKTSRL